jgi:hypothetical protein
VYWPGASPAVDQFHAEPPHGCPRTHVPLGYCTKNSYSAVGQSLELAVRLTVVPATCPNVEGLIDAEVQPVRVTMLEPIDWYVVGDPGSCVAHAWTV